MPADISRYAIRSKHDGSSTIDDVCAGWPPADRGSSLDALATNEAGKLCVVLDAIYRR